MKINKLCLYFLIILAGVIVPKVNAKTYNLREGTDIISPTTFENRINSGASLNINFQGGLNGAIASYDDIVNLSFDLCATNNNFSIYRTSNLGAACSNSCFSQNSVIVDSGQSCTTYGGSYAGHLFKVYLPITKVYINAGTSQVIYEVNDYFTIKNSSNWSAVYAMSNFTFNNDDISVIIGNNNINSSINSMSDNIISNQNSNTQSIINNQNSNAAQAHQDAQTAHQDAQTAHNDSVNTQNTIKDDNVDNPNSSITTIKNSLATNGVITSLVVLPVTLYQAVLNSVNGTCATFSLGSLFGTNLTIPCINVSNYLGTTLWGSIDVIISGIFIYMISRKMVKVFNQLSSLKEGDVLDG